MILSNEPGYYKTGAYGIRIENLVLVVEASAGRRRRQAAQRLRDADACADRPPPDRAALLTADEIAWLDAYHARVLAETLARWSMPRRGPGSRKRPQQCNSPRK